MRIPLQFVRDTVREFYQRFKTQSATGESATDDEICPAEDDLTIQLMLQNGVLRKRCGAVPIELLKDGLQLARKYVDLLIEVLYYIMNLCMDLMQLMGDPEDSQRERLTNSLFYWFWQMLLAMGDAMRALGDIFFKLVLDISPLGYVLKAFLHYICIIIQWIVNDVWKGFLCPIMEIILPHTLNALIAFLSSMREALDIISGIFLFGIQLPTTGTISWFITTATEFKTKIETHGLGCDKNASNICFAPSSMEPPSIALPSATR